MIQNFFRLLWKIWWCLDDDVNYPIILRIWRNVLSEKKFFWKFCTWLSQNWQITGEKSKYWENDFISMIYFKKKNNETFFECGNDQSMFIQPKFFPLHIISPQLDLNSRSFHFKLISHQAKLTSYQKWHHLFCVLWKNSSANYESTFNLESTNILIPTNFNKPELAIVGAACDTHIIFSWRTFVFFFENYGF